jgi:glycosyltransferase involved in cell wall biosynthesis
VRSISTLAEDPVLRTKFAMKGRELVESKYSLDQFAGSYIQLMREVAAR